MDFFNDLILLFKLKWFEIKHNMLAAGFIDADMPDHAQRCRELAQIAKTCRYAIIDGKPCG